ncbi:hypothetical protein D0860_06641 [Hortaea werneckii]|uniref:Carboxylic ester hydrolase n=1 Tax=Hortaea werneckii TaxID=91943 RepID=A0A3M7GSR4_HORWE|nr:putative ferulic acid Esterase/Feruloyl esterase [Hortaea werneckii]RMZ03807.1 hypothetical protein D0860_06641 [Hortaea werneckii]RMZ28277.1 hypothetical protein D0859_07633 [Hortaea werneckii]
MHLSTLSLLSLLASTGLAFNCTREAFADILPSNASVSFTRSIPVDGNSTFVVPAGDIAYPTSPTGLQPLCAVQINVSSSDCSAYSFGLFLPNEWNERFLAVGNGGFAGGINWLDMGAGVGYGFAVMSTDTGHNSTPTDIEWALNSPQKKIDWGYRAMHGSVELSKHIVESYYNQAPKYNYYSGCSTGGRQGIREIQLYPDDFDGVLAGAPAWWTSHLQTWTVKIGLYNSPNASASHIPPSLFGVVGAEILKQCDPQDGLVDNIISDPEGCNVNLEAMLCGPNVTNQTTAACLSAEQIGTLYKIYNDYVDVNQTFVFPHLELGSEAQWPVLLGLGEPAPLGTEFVRYFLLNDPTWNYTDFSYDTVELADELDPGNATADDFDLSPFYHHGGKLLHYHGYADALIATGSSIYFYNQVLKTLKPRGIDLDSWYRFFLIPGMQHCTGTPESMDAPWYIAGANQAGALNSSVHSVPGFCDAKHDALLALMAWVEKDEAPESLVATKFVNETLPAEVQRQRPLCPYPQQAKFGGQGDPDEARNWKCEGLYSMRTQYS